MNVNLEYDRITASFCVDNARALGLPAAILLDKILRLSRYSTREDGFCWYTAKQFEAETSLKEDSFLRAAKLLEKAGVVERKVTFIQGTTRKATHFRVVKTRNTTERNPAQSGDVETSSERGSILYPNSTINPPAPAAQQPRPSASASPKEEASFLDEKIPFDVPIKSMRQTGRGNSLDRMAFAIAGKIYKQMGITVKPGVKIRNRIKDRLAEGYTEEDMLECVAWCDVDGFYKDQPDPMARLSEHAMAKYMADKAIAKAERQGDISETEERSLGE